MWRRVRHFTSFADVLLCAQMVGLWCGLPLLLCFPLDRVLAWLTPRKFKPLPAALAQRRYAKILLFTNYWFSRQPVAARNSCLKSALVWYYLGQRAGLPVRFCLGVRKDQTDLAGHSWIECADPTMHPPAANSLDFTLILQYPLNSQQECQSEALTAKAALWHP